MIAILLMGVVAASLLSALATSSTALSVADKRETAKNIAESQTEYVKNQGYAAGVWNYTVSTSGRSSSQQPSWWDPGNDIPPLLSGEYTGYSAELRAENLDADNDSTIEVPGDDEGIRLITVTVKHNAETVIVLESYKTK
jgi:type II secretory pathway pseudopilin PulG